MSSDFLYDVEDDEGNVILLTVLVSGFAELTVIHKTEEGNIINFRLTADENGYNNAIKIANALKYWVEHTKKN